MSSNKKHIAAVFKGLPILQYIQEADAFEVNGCVIFEDGDVEVFNGDNGEQPDFYTVYAHVAGRGVMAMIDCIYEHEAVALKEFFETSKIMVEAIQLMRERMGI